MMGVITKQAARDVLNNVYELSGAFVWGDTPQGHNFWSAQKEGLSREGRAILERIAYGEQPLTIREGCYYRTRDGRKVGPMKLDWFYDTYFGEGARWQIQCDGKALGDHPESDLVAEWQDEPVLDTSTAGFTVPLDAYAPVAEATSGKDTTTPSDDQIASAYCLVETGVCTINEVRAVLGYGPLSSGGHLLASAA